MKKTVLIFITAIIIFIIVNYLSVYIKDDDNVDENEFIVLNNIDEILIKKPTNTKKKEIIEPKQKAEIKEIIKYKNKIIYKPKIKYKNKIIYKTKIIYKEPKIKIKEDNFFIRAQQNKNKRFIIVKEDIKEKKWDYYLQQELK